VRRSPGDLAVLRDVYRSRVWSARPGCTVDDDGHRELICFPLGTTCQWPCDRYGGDLRIPTEEWHFQEGPWTKNSHLHFVESGAIWTASVQWTDTREFAGWKVDFHAPWRRSRFGFDGLDWAIDVMINPDRTWHLKDELEFATYRERGLLSDGEVREVTRTLSEQVVPDLDARRGPFHPDWEQWTPMSDWTASALPEGWAVP
jgi:hypothetical protein